MNKKTAAIILDVCGLCAFSYQAQGDEFEVKSLNLSSTGSFVFSPEFVWIKPGDAVNFVATDKGHPVYSVPGMIPDRAQPLDAKMSQDIEATFVVPGVYVIACRPHMFMGMISVVLAGDPINIDKPDGQSPDQTRNLARAPREKLNRAKGRTAARRRYVSSTIFHAATNAHPGHRR